MKLALIMLSFAVSFYGNAHAQTSAFEQIPTQNNQVLVSLPNKYDASDIIKVEVNDQSYLSVHYRNKTTGRDDSVWCARYTKNGLVKTASASEPVAKPLCDAGIAAFNKASKKK